MKSASGLPAGVVHGRFQPFHLGHLEYLDQAVARCENLVVGITNADPGTRLAEADCPHRHAVEANPFSFLDRLRMVLGSLEELARPPRCVWVVPFPIHAPEHLGSYLPPDAVHYVRVFSPWEATKVERLRHFGHRVETLPTRAGKAITGTRVRRLLAECGAWEELVPRGSARVIREVLLGLPEGVG